MEIYKVYVLPEHTELMYKAIKHSSAYLLDYTSYKHCTVFYTSILLILDELKIPVMVSKEYLTGYGYNHEYTFQSMSLSNKTQLPYWLKTQHKRYQTYKLLKLIGQ